MLRSIWSQLATQKIEVITSELSVLECLVGPLKQRNPALEAQYDQFFAFGQIRLAPISLDILRAAAKLRAATATLRTPDAIHAATAMDSSSHTTLTNDSVYTRLPGLNAQLLETLSP